MSPLAEAAVRPTRKIVAEFVAVFLIGAAFGGVVGWVVTDKFTDTQLSSFMSRTNDPDNLVARINEKYATEFHLNPDELTRIQPDIKELAQATYQVRHQFGVDVVAVFDKYHNQIAQKLDADHRDAYEKWSADRHKTLSALLLPDQAPSAPDGK